MRSGFVLVFLCIALNAWAQRAIEVDDTINEHIYYLRELTYYIDFSNKLTLHDITDPTFNRHFSEHGSYQNKDYQTNASYWIRFPVHHNPKTKKVWLLEFYDQSIDHLEAYIPRDDGSYEMRLMGDNNPFEGRTFRHKNFEIMMDMKRDTVVYYYFKVRSHEFADIRMVFHSIDQFVYYALNEYFLYGTFYGMILIIALYNFLVYLAIREIKNIYYILYILSVALYAMSLDGIGFQYLWPHHPQWNDYAVGISLYSVILWALVFTRRFLSTKTKLRFHDTALKWMIVFRSALFLIELFFFPEFFSDRVIEIIPLSLIFYTGIRVWSRGYRPARFFVIAYGLLLFGFFLRTLVYFNVLPITIASHYSLHFSFVFEMLFLTFALGDRIRILKNNRDRALKRIINQHEINTELQNKVNKELEEKVLERTVALNKMNADLEESNHKLERQSTEINQINSILDLDNWKLKNSIKEVLTERLHEKTLDYKQFQTLYPDTLACYRFLESLKWPVDFHCRKCNNDRYFEGSNKFARRCTRCGYNESITAYTIFHSIKFPIEKAFYIAYLVVAGKKDSTLEALATQLDLRLNTIWSFKTKVTERLHELEKGGKKPTVSRWEEVILSLDHSHPIKPKGSKHSEKRPLKSN